MNFRQARQSFFSWIVLVLLGAWAAISLFLAVRNTFTPLGGNDLYTYWYAGLLIRQAEDPYAAFIARQPPSLPVTFLDGEAHSLSEIKIPGLVPAPANTYPLIFILTLFSFLSWSTAKVAWLLCNLVLVLILPFLVIRLLPDDKCIERKLVIALFFVFLGFTSTRYALSSGQLSFLVFAMLLGSALLVKRRPWLAGLLMGIALSKYSLSLGFFLYFLLVERRLRMSITAILVQVCGIVLLVWISGSPVLQVLEEYRAMFVHHAPMEGIQLSVLLSSGGSNPALSAVFSLLVGVLITWYAIRNPVSREAPPLVRFCLLTILLLWSLLVGYHRAYDALTYLLFLGLAVSMDRVLMNQPRLRWLHLTWRGFAIFSAVCMMLPAGSLVRAGMPEPVGVFWITLVSKLTSLILLLALFLCLFTLLFWLGKHSFSTSQLAASD